MPNFNLRHASFKEALVEAKRRSGLTNEEISNRSGIPSANVSRFFSLYDQYYPSPEKVPALCRVLGNTLPAEWISAQVSDMKARDPIACVIGLSQAVMQAGHNTGELCKLAVQAAEDGELTPEEAKTLQARAFANKAYLLKLIEQLEPVAKGECAQYRKLDKSLPHDLAGGKP